MVFDNGSGLGKVKIFIDVFLGIYELIGYIWYMRNEGEKVFFRKFIVVINIFWVLDFDFIELVDFVEIYLKGKLVIIENIYIKIFWLNYNIC